MEFIFAVIYFVGHPRDFIRWISGIKAKWFLSWLAFIPLAGAMALTLHVVNNLTPAQLDSPVGQLWIIPIALITGLAFVTLVNPIILLVVGFGDTSSESLPAPCQ